MHSTTIRHKKKKHCSWLNAVLVLLMFLTASFVYADEETALIGEPRFDVRSAFIEPVEGIYQLHATLDLALSNSAQQALREGVPVTFFLDARIERKRQYLPDKQVAEVTQRWEIRYDALSERYLVSDSATNSQSSYATLQSALVALADVRGVPMGPIGLIEKGKHYEASLRAVAVIEGGLPSALKVMMFWVDWRRETDWYTWTLRP